MWFIGALLGGLLFAALWSDGWVLGALIGAAAGVWLNHRQSVASPDTLDRILKLEQQLGVLSDEMRQVRQRLAALEQDEATNDRPAAATVTPETELELALKPQALTPVPEVVPNLVAVAAVDPGDLPPAPPAPAASARTASGRSGPTRTRHTPPTLPPRFVEWLTGGNMVARIGVVILFFGVAFLLKHAYETYDLPIELRLTGVALGAVALLIVGWRLRESRAGYALALQGGGVGLLYLTIFAAFRLYALLPALPAFALLFGVAALAAMLAVLQDARVLAVLGAAGGFLAPILASTGDGSHVLLFGYYAVLNAGILAIAWFKAWRVLNLTGFVFTFGIAGMWVHATYQPEQFASTQPFLLLFFLMYVAIAVLFARRGGDRNARVMDGTLLFGVPLLSFAMQLKLVEAFEYGAAWSALALGLFYLLLTRYLLRREASNLMPQALLAIGVVFATLAIPLAFDGRWTSAAWAVEGAGILWVGVRQKRLTVWAFGAALQILAGLFYLSDFVPAVGDMPLLNSIFLGALLLALSGLFCAWMLDRKTDTDDARGVAIRHLAGLALFAWGVIWWAAAGLNEIDQHVEPDYQTHTALLFAAASCLGFSWLALRLAWAVARIPALALLPLMALAALAELDQSMLWTSSRPFAHLGWLAWPAAFAAHGWLLRRHDDAKLPALEWLHAGGFWLLAGLGAWQVAWMIDDWVAGQAVWPLIAWALVPGTLLALSTMQVLRQRWPLRAWPNAYLGWGALPLAASLAVWFLWATLGSDANPAPLPYVPLLNPLDLAQAGALLVLVSWFADTRRMGMMPVAGMPLAAAWAGLGIGGFVWANAVLLRTLHHYADVPFRIDALLGSDLVQASLSLFWTLIALVAMVLATRRGWRALWMVGAGLMFAVVLKLLLVDLSNVGTIERIVSFVGVGLLMLVVGYFAPAPPKAINTEDTL